MKIALCLSGLINLELNETLESRLKNLTNYLNFDRIYMQVWHDDFYNHINDFKKLPDSYNKIITDFPSKYLNENFKNDIKITTDCDYRTTFNLVCQFYGIQTVIQKSLLEDNDIFIRCRYDLEFYEYFDPLEYLDLLNDNKPVLIVPHGGNYRNGLGDIFYIMNKKAALILSDLLSVMNLKDYPQHPETLFRTFVINKNKVDVYRINLDVKIKNKMLYFKKHKAFNNITYDNFEYNPNLITNQNEIIWIPDENNYEDVPSKATDIDKNFKLNSISYQEMKILIKKFEEEWYHIKFDDSYLHNQKKNTIKFKKSSNLYLEDLDIVIVFKIDSTDRLRNLKKNIEYLNFYFKNKITLIEHDKEKKFIPEGNINYIFIEKKELNFNKNEVSNLYYKKTNKNIILNLDCDVILDYESILDCYKKIKNNEFSFAMPFDGFLIMLNEKSTENFVCKNELPEIWKHYYGIENSLSHFDNNPLVIKSKFWNNYQQTRHPGFAYMFDKNKFINCGLENQYVKKWGYDDWERLCRVEKMGYRVYYSFGNAYHLWHTRNDQKNDWYVIDDINEKEMLKSIVYNKHELTEYIKTWPWVKQ